MKQVISIYNSLKTFWVFDFTISDKFKIKKLLKFPTTLKKTNVLKFLSLEKISEFQYLLISIQAPKLKTQKPDKFPISSNKTSALKLTKTEKISGFLKI